MTGGWLCWRGDCLGLQRSDELLAVRDGLCMLFAWLFETGVVGYM